MTTLSPVAVALAIIVAVAFAGAVIAYFRSRMQIRGYEDIAGDARQIARGLKAELFRDGNDLVISGNHASFPTIIRFSYDENTPGLDLRMSAPASFTMSVVPKGARATEGRVQVKTPSENFDARFVTRSDQPTQAKMLLSSKLVQSNLEKLCCSPKTFLTVNQGLIEVSELVVPDVALVRHVMGHVAEMAAIATACKTMPGAETVKIQKFQHERHLAFRLALAAGIVAAIFAVVVAVETPPTNEVQAQGLKAQTGITPAVAAVIRNSDPWRLARPADFDPDAAAWARGRGGVPAGFTAMSVGSGNAESSLDGAYVLTDARSESRVALIYGMKNVWDMTFKKVCVAVRVPHELFPTIQWAGTNPPQPQPDGDGFLIVRDTKDPASGLIVFLVKGHVATAAPADYTRVRLQ